MFTENLYSVVGSGELWQYGSNCSAGPAYWEPWCYTHIHSTRACTSCGLGQPAGQLHLPYITQCVNSGGCNETWFIKTF
jgi:hypothetical protein